MNIQIFIIWSLNIFVRTFWLLSFDTRLENIVYSIFQSKVKYSVIGHPLLIVLPSRELPGGYIREVALLCSFSAVSFCSLDRGFLLFGCCPVPLFETSWTAACQAPLSCTISWSLLKFMSIELVMPSNHLILCYPLLLLPLVFPSIRVFSSELSLLIRRSKYWSFSTSPSREYSGLISFRMDWFDLLAVQGTPKSPPAPQFSPTLTSIHDYWKKYSCLENPIVRGAWRATVCGVAKSWTWLKIVSTHSG